ncbi:MAG: chromosome partitioning protein ParA, partial [Sphingomicrobium sp.]
AEDSAKRMHVPFLGRLPLSVSIRTASDKGEPPALGDSSEGAAFAAIAGRLLEALEKAGS